MRLVLDTHALLWALSAPSKLPVRTAAALRDPANDVFVSVASVWEIAIKTALGKLSADVDEIVRTSLEVGFEELAVTLVHVRVACTRFRPGIAPVRSDARRAGARRWSHDRDTRPHGDRVRRTQSLGLMACSTSKSIMCSAPAAAGARTHALGPGKCSWVSDCPA